MLTAQNADRDLKARILNSAQFAFNAAASLGNFLFCDPARSYKIRAVNLLYITTSTSSVLGVNAVQIMDFVDSSGSGTFTIGIEGTTTAAITYNATFATLAASITSALNTTFGVSNIVVGGSTLANMTLTFSGGSFQARAVGLAVVTLLSGATGFTATPSSSVTGSGKVINIGSIGTSSTNFISGAASMISQARGVVQSVTLGANLILAAGDTLTVDMAGAASANTGAVIVLVEMSPVENTTPQGSLAVTN